MRKDKLKNTIYAVLVVGVMLGLFAWPSITDETRLLVKDWKAAGVDCLSSHQAAAQHIHQQISIKVDGEKESIPEDTGIVRSCMAELHVHAGEPVIHTESVLANKKFNLANFFSVYGKTLVRDGYNLKLIVNGVEYLENPAELIFEDKQVIELEYIKSTQ